MSCTASRRNRHLNTTRPGPGLTTQDTKILGLAAIGLGIGGVIWLLGKAGILALAALPALALREEDGIINTSELERRIDAILSDAEYGYHTDARRALAALEAELGHPAEILVDHGRHAPEEWIHVSAYLDRRAGVRVADNLHNQHTVIIDIH